LANPGQEFERQNRIDGVADKNPDDGACRIDLIGKLLQDFSRRATRSSSSSASIPSRTLDILGV
jgi:hypothetical protein